MGAGRATIRHSREVPEVKSGTDGLRELKS